MAKANMVMAGFSDEAKKEIDTLTSSFCGALTESISKISVLMSSMDGKAKNNITNVGTQNLASIGDILQKTMILYKESIGEAMDQVIAFGDRNGDDGMVDNGRSAKQLVESYDVPPCAEAGIVPGGEEVTAAELDSFVTEFKTIVQNTRDSLQDVKPKVQALCERETIYRPSFNAVWGQLQPMLADLNAINKSMADGAFNALENTVTFQKNTHANVQATATVHSGKIKERSEQSRKDVKGVVDSML